MASGGTVGVAVIGTNFGRLTHIPGYRACPLAEIRAVMSRDATRTRRVADEFRIPQAVTNLDRLLALPGIHLVSIATGGTVHAECAIACLSPDFAGCLL